MLNDTLLLWHNNKLSYIGKHENKLANYTDINILFFPMTARSFTPPSMIICRNLSRAYKHGSKIMHTTFLKVTIKHKK